MNPFAVIFAICCLASARARPGFSHGTSTRLEGVPNESHYGKLTYPKYELIELGSSVKGSLPPSVVEITKKIVIKEPRPYPVKVPVPVPHPVEVARPYPVVETKIVRVPHPVPVEVIKQVPVPVEVPKPYPVPSHEVKAPSSDAPISTYGGSFGGHEGFGHQQLNGIHEDSQQNYGGGYGGGIGNYGSSGSESNGWGASLAPQEHGGWGAPLGGSDHGDSHEGSDQSGGYEQGYEGSQGDYAQADSSQTYTAQVEPEPELEYHPTGWIPIPSSRALGYHVEQRQH